MVDIAENLDISMLLYNFLEYSNNYSMISGSLWNYYRDKVIDDANEIVANHRLNNHKTTSSKFFDYQTKMIRRTPTDNNTLDREIVVPLKHFLSNFWRSLDLTLINWEIKLDSVWSKDCLIFIILNHVEVFADPPDNSSVTDLLERFSTSATFEIITAKLNVQTICQTLENINRGIKRTTSWNKYRSEIKVQSKNNNLDYMIDSIFRIINRLFVLSFKNDSKINYFDKFYMPQAKIKDFNALIDNKLFLINPYCKIIGIELSWQTNTSIPQQINFTGKVDKDDGVATFFIAEKQQKTILNFSFDSLIKTE